MMLRPPGDIRGTVERVGGMGVKSVMQRAFETEK